MKRGVVGSVAMHGAIVLAALFGLPAMKAPEIKPVEAIQVDISNITSETKVKAQSKSAEKKVDKPKPKASESVEKTKPKEKVTEEKKVAAKEPVKQEEQKKVEPEEKKVEPKKEEPKKEPEKKSEPKKVEDVPLDSDPLKELLAVEEQKVAEQKQLEEKKKKEEEKKKKAEEKKKADEEKKQAEEKKKAAEAEKKAAEEKKKIEAEKKARKLDVAELEDLLNKENTESSAPTEKKAETGTPDKAETDTVGDDAESKANFRDALQAKITECFSPPPASKDEGVNIVVKVEFVLNRDGTLQRAPRFNQTGDPLFDAVGSAAMSAVAECGPYDFFPDGKYDGYNKWRLNFDPRDAK